MRFTLKGYQVDALAELMTALRHAKTFYSATEVPYPQAVSLTATTGAGKTVIATAAIEALFYGNEDLDLPADEGAVVLWFSHMPTLNSQSRDRLREASDMLTYGDLVTVQNTFDEPVLSPRKVYFLNHSKLRQGALLVRGDQDVEQTQLEPQLHLSRPDARAMTFWDTLRNTIKDPNRTLYMFLDEAHEGMGEKTGTKEERTTIVKRVINGHGDVPATPIILGLTATPAKFIETAKTWGDSRNVVRRVQVDSSEVQASGLLKDQFALDFSRESGDFNTVLLRRATRQLQDISERWADYAQDQAEGEQVIPLMILQLPNSPEPDDVAEAIDTIRQAWPKLAIENFAHVLADHTPQQFGSYSIPYVAPERVEDYKSIRVLLAKDAISTGWDCPRAEVMVSFRPAVERTYITQMLGRMVRTPLARRIPGDDVLGTVYCYLPRFDQATTEQIAVALENGEDGSTTPDTEGRRVLINPQPHDLPIQRDTEGQAILDENGQHVLLEDVPEVLDKLETLPTQSITRAITKPVKRLTRLAHALSTDMIKHDALHLAHEEMHAVLDGARGRYASQLKAALEELHNVKVTTVFVKHEPQNHHRADEPTVTVRPLRRTAESVERADDRVIEHAFKTARNAFGSAVAKSYVKHLAAQNTEAEDHYEALVEAEALVAALSNIEDVRSYFDDEAEALTEKWFDETAAARHLLSQARQDVYREIRQLAREPQTEKLARPSNRMEPTQSRYINGDTNIEPVDLPTFAKHLLVNRSGQYPGDFNDWETHVLSTELARNSTVRWYRNPAQAKPESLGVAYEQAGEAKIMRPDFLFFSTRPDGSIAASIVDPHRHDLSDALPKIKGLAKYAEQYGHLFARIETLSKVGDQYRVLDLLEQSVCSAVLEAQGDAKELYDSQFARDYA